MYECHTQIEVNQAPEILFPWLIEPQQMLLWICGLDECSWINNLEAQIGSTFRLTSFTGGQRSEYAGEIRALEKNKYLEKNFSLQGIKAGGWLPTDTGTDEYQRIVRYKLLPASTGTRLICTTATNIPGMKPYVAEIARKTEQKHLNISLSRLQAVVTKGKIPLANRLWNSFSGKEHLFSPL